MPAESGPRGRERMGVLVALELLCQPRAEEPRPEPEVPLLLDRLSWVGRPMVLVGPTIGDRQLPTDPGDRAAWVRATLGIEDATVLHFEEGGAERPAEEEASEAVERWRALAEAQDAAWLLTGRESSVGPARQAGLAVVLVGPRVVDAEPGVVRADHEARDLRDAVTHILVSDVFPTTVAE